MSAFAIAFVLLLWLPGHLAFRLSASPKAPQRRWPAAERLFSEVSLSGLLILWVAVSLGLLGVLTPGALILACSLITLALLAVVLKKRNTLGGSPGYRPGASAVLAGALVVVGAWLYAPQFEQVVGGRDPTTYILSAIHMGRTGSWIAHDEIVTTLQSGEARRALLGTVSPGRFGDWGPRFLGWYLMDPDTGKVVPQGLPLYPSAIAVGYMLADVQGAMRVTKVLAIAAVLALFFLGRRLLNPATGLTAAMLLLVSPAQVWFSRFANAETLTQLLLLTGLYGLVVHRRHGGWAYGLLAAMAFGLSWQAHIWMVWIALPLLGILVFDLLQARVDRQTMLLFWAPLLALGMQALAVYLAVTTAYLWGVYAVLRWSMWAVIPAIPALAAILAGLWYWGRQRSSTADAPTDPRRGVGWSRTAAAIAVALAAAYGYLLRPMVSSAWSAESVQRLVLAVTLAVLGFAVAGIMMLLLDRRRGLATLCLLAVALGIIVPVLWHPGIRPPLMWSLRRYQMFLPLVFLFAAVPLWIDRVTLSKRVADWRQRFLGMAHVMVAVVLIAMVGAQGLAYRGFKEPGESIALIDSVAATLEDGALLVFEARSGWGVLDLAAPLAYWKGFDVVWLRFKDEQTNSAVLRDLVRREAQRGRSVYFFTQGFNYYMSEPRMEPHGRWWFYQQQLDETFGELPTTVQSSRFPFSVYKLEASGANEPLDGMLDVGYWDDNYVGEALPWEANWIYSARWTKGTAFFWLPGIDESTGEIIVHAMTVEDSEAYGRTLSARLDGVVMGEIPIAQDWTDYIFEVPSGWRPTEGVAPKLELSTQPLQPDAVNGNGDTRYLGVLVNAILWR